MRRIFYSLIVLTTSCAAYGGNLSCSKISNYITQTPTAEVRAICNTAEARCLAQKYINQLDEKEPVRQTIEDRLTAQVEFELEVCEAMLKSLKIDVK